MPHLIEKPCVDVSEFLSPQQNAPHCIMAGNFPVTNNGRHARGFAASDEKAAEWTAMPDHAYYVGAAHVFLTGLYIRITLCSGLFCICFELFQFKPNW